MERRELAGGQQEVRAGSHGRRHGRLSVRARAAARASGLTGAALPATVAFAATVGVSAANGGYFPIDFGWAALGFLALAATAQLVVERVEVDALDWALLACASGVAAWIALSATWAPSAARPLLEAERTVLYLAAAASLVLLVRRRSAAALLAGLVAGIAVVAAYALATRLLPDVPWIAGETARGVPLAEPLGYSNALAILVVLGTLLALGFAADAARPAVRAAAATALPVLASALFLTFSRGGWLALGIGAAAAVAFHASRRRLVVLGAIVLVPAGVAVWLCSRAEAVTEAGATDAEAAAAGHRLAIAIGVLAVCSAALGVATNRLERLVAPARPPVAVAAAIALAAVLAAVLASGAGWSSSFRADYWSVAADVYAEHPWLGAGAGSFERFWLEERPVNFFSRDAHSVYVETLAEQGPVGLVLVLGLLGVPLAALTAVRRRPYAPAAAAAYIAFVVHAGLDWDWEMPVVMLAGLSCGVALVAWRRRGVDRPLAPTTRAAGLVIVAALAGFVAVMHVANSALAASSEAHAAGDQAAAAAHARTARRWAPWSHEPWEKLGEAQLSAGEIAAARGSFREALERDPENWSLWVDLAIASEGAERRRALDEALRLNPLSVEARELRALASA